MTALGDGRFHFDVIERPAREREGIDLPTWVNYSTRSPASEWRSLKLQAMDWNRLSDQFGPRR